jgi:hypothetical protein
MNSTNSDDINSILSLYNTISLEEMSSVSLMNRIDTKFITSSDMLCRILDLAQRNYRVQEVNGLRNILYNTIYLDTDERTMFLAHHNGRSVREKIRIRTYESSGISFLEVKNKNNKGRTDKKRIQIEDNKTIDEYRGNHFLHQYAWYDLSEISEKLQNTFNRITLVNNQMTERITIDTNVTFTDLQSDKEVTMYNLGIIEIKQSGNNTSIIKNILHDMHVQQASISKYCVGSVLTNPALKHNRFKPKIRQIAQLQNK